MPDPYGRGGRRLSAAAITALLAGGAVLVAFAAQGFTNAVEWLGYRLGLDDRILGGVLAAWGTALPETVVPLVAVAAGTHAGHEVGVGAILGAPFLLATLAFGLLGMTVLLRARRGREDYLKVVPRAASRDLLWFVLFFSVALAAGLPPLHAARRWAILALLMGYAAYLAMALRGSAQGAGARPERFLLWQPLRDPALLSVLGVLAVSLAALVGGAQVFVLAVTALGHRLAVSPLILAVILAPLATELPEVINSVVWTWHGRDDLALSAVTGAMIIQSTIGPTLGLLLTSWKLGPEEQFAGILALCAAGFFALGLRLMRRMEAGPLLFGAAFYAMFLIGIAVWRTA